MMAAVNRKFDTSQGGQPPNVRRSSDLVPSSQHPPTLHAHAMSPLGHLPSHSNLAPHPQMRPEMSRAITFPTPPSSASSLNMNGSENPYWNQPQMMQNSGSQPLAIDTVINSSRSMPTTPATTPPGNALAQLQQYPTPGSFNEPRSSPLYATQSQSMSQSSVSQQNMNRFGPPLPNPHYINQQRDNNMPPPTSRGPNASRPSSSQNNPDGQVKDENEEQSGIVEEEEQEQQEEEADHEPEHEYDSGNVNQYNNANGRGYFNSVETPHLSPEMTGSPGHQGPGTPNRSVYSTPNVNVSRNMDNVGQTTPRTATTPQQQQWVPNSGYSTPPRGAPNTSGVRGNPPPAARGIYSNIMGDGADRAVEGTNGASGDNYGQHGMGVPVTPQQTPSYGSLNGSNKRIREMDDQESHSRPSSRGDEERGANDGNELKRRKTIREGTTPTANMGTGNFDSRDPGRLNRSRSINPRRGR